jgi:hypothetical protein
MLLYAFGHLLQRFPPSFFALPQHFFFFFLAMLLSCFIASIFIVIGFFPTSTPRGGCPRIAIFSQIEANSEKLPEAYT